MKSLLEFFGANGFIPHGYCLAWSPTLLWLNILSDSFIVLAYYSIPIILGHFVRQRKDIPFSWVFYLFALFIAACGTTHLLSVITLWIPLYWLDAMVKTVTAIASVLTAVLSLRIVPTILKYRSPSELLLEIEVKQRRITEVELQNLTCEQNAMLDHELFGIMKVRDRQIIWKNKAIDQMFGYAPGELEGRSTRILYPDDSSFQKLGEDAYPILNLGQPYTVEQNLIRKDGKKLWINTRGILLSGETNEILLMLLDITERKQAEQDLEKSRNRFYSIIQQSPFSIQMFDRDGTCMQANASWEKLWGFSAKDIVGYNILQDPQLTRKGVMPYIEKAFAGEAAEIPTIVYNPEEHPGYEAPAKTNWVRSFIYPITQPSGQISEVILCHEDITARIRAETALKKSELMLKMIFEHSMDGIAVADAETLRFHFVNPSFRRMLGYTPEELYAMNVMDVHFAEDLANIREIIGNLLQGTVGLIQDLAFRRKDGSKLWVDNNASFLELEGKLHIMGIFRDITERKRHENQIYRLNQVYAALAQTNRIARNSKTETELFQAVCRIAVEDGGMKMACIGMTQADNDGIQSVAFYGEGNDYPYAGGISVSPDIPRAPRACETALREARTLIVQDYRNPALNGPCRDCECIPASWRSRASFPIFRSRSPEHAYAVFTLFHAEKHAFDELNAGLLKSMVADIGFSLDVFDKEQARQTALHALRESEERYRDLTEQLPNQIWTATPNGQLDYVNQRLIEYFGKPAWRFFEDNWQGVVHPDDLPETLKKWTGAVQTGQPHEVECRLRHHSGEYRWCNTKALPVRDQQGQITKWYGVNADIDDRKRAEKALTESEARFRHLANIAPVTIYLTDANGKCVFVNENWLELTGFSRESTLGDGWADTLYAEDRERVYREWYRAFAANEVFNCEYRIVALSGEIKEVLGRAVALYDDRQVAQGYIGVLVDITTRIRAEQMLVEAKQLAENTARLKSEFLAKMSHEIRTPMNAIIGLTELVLQTELSAKQCNYLNKINTSAQWLLGIINDILDFSKIEAGELRLDRRDFNLKDVIQYLNDVSAPLLNGMPLSLRFEVDPDAPDGLIGDSLRLGQVLLNLITNAIKFTEAGTVTVRVEALSVDDGQACLRFSVTDNGIGISQEQQTQLFQPFKQAEHTSARHYGGTGLGLVISKSLVEAMGGKIGVESSLGSGSTFYFTVTLEVRTADMASLSQPRAIDPDDISRLKHAHLLLVEDNPINQEMMLDMLRNRGVRADLANNGEEAIAMIGERDYSAVLMDCRMPVMDGYAATRLIRANPRFADLPIIAMTANVMPEDRENCYAAGMNDYIGKPISGEKLFRMLARWVEPRSPVAAGEKSAVDESNFPVLTGVDLDALKQSIDNNAALYRKMLSLFRAKHADDAALIRAAYRAGDYEAAADVSHKLIGSTGFMRMDKLNALVMDLDQALKQRQDDKVLEPMLEKIAAVMTALIKEIDQTNSIG